MAKDSWHGNASAFSAYWQLPLLRVMLRSTGISGVLTPLVATAFSGKFRHEFLLALVVGAFLLALSFAKLERARLVAVTYVSVALITTLVFGAWFGWVPDVVAMLSYLVVAGGLLFGPRFVYGLVLSVGALLFLGGVLVHAGVFGVEWPPELNPASYQTWLRTAVGFALLAGAAAWVLLEASKGVLRAEADASRALALAESSLRETEASRARRLLEEQALLDAQKLQSVAQLGDGFAHVASNSLTIVCCACEEAKAGSVRARRSAAVAIRDAIDECASRTRDLLLLSRPHKSAPARVELHSVVLTQAENLEQRLRSNIQCVFDLEPAGAALVSPSWLPQILTNLLLNAEAAIHGRGTIEISTRMVQFDETRTSTIDRLPPGAYAALAVTDDGEGMTPEIIAHACEPFFTTRGRAGHDGLGLTLVHSMVRQVGGTLSLSSDGHGSRVTVYFPLGDAAPQVTAAPHDASAARAEVSSTASEPSTPGPAAVADTSGALVLAGRAAPESIPAPQAAASDSARAVASSDWRVGALRRTARTAAFVALAGAAAMASFLDDWLAPVLFVLATLPLMVFVSGPRRLPYYLRFTLVLGTLASTGVLFVLQYSFMSPGAIAMLSQTVFLASLFGGRWIAACTLVLITLTFVGGGLVWPHLDSAAPLHEMLFDAARNWFRVGLILPLVLLINGHTMLDVFRLAADRVATLELARRELEHRQAQHHAETEALVRAEGMRGRAERMATAGRLTGVVAHDLNNSLMTLFGWAELLETSQTPDEALQNLQQAVEHAEAMLQTLRGTSVLDHRGPGLDLAGALGRVRAMLHAVWQTEASQSCTLELEADAECYVEIQEGSFRRLLVNLVTNARHALGERAGSCTVRVRHDSHGVQLSVVDTGPGMDQATRRRIFEPFFTTKPNYGTGLGLLSVSEIVSATGGSLEVRSEPGHGSTFAIRWPLATPGALPARDSAPLVSVSNAARVLLAEDEPMVRKLLARGLRSQGYDVVEAEDGDVAMRQLSERGPFDALCTDAVMPGRSVFELISEYQATRARGLVLVLSGYLPENLAPLLGRAGVRLLRKPFSHAFLAAELERLRRGAA